MKQFHCVGFILDGRNTDKGLSFASYGQTSKGGDFMATELAIFDELQRAVPEAVLVNAVGLTMPDNLLILSKAHYAVAPWGASLVKYRWICKLPNYVFTSRWNRENRNDLQIYDDPRLMEVVPPIAWVDPLLVQDLPEAPRFVSATNEPQWWNFTVAVEQVVDHILREMTDTLRQLRRPAANERSPVKLPRF